MGLAIGIIGLPNVGKSTLFNALTGAQNAAAESYPFCTVEPNRAVVPVPDERLEGIAEITEPEKVTPTTIQFVDIAGLVENASKGEGLGNQFLSHVAEADALAHLVRCFEDENVAHVAAELDPVRDMEVVETELVLRDIELLERRVEDLSREARANKDALPRLQAAEGLLGHLNEGEPIMTFPDKSAEAVRPLLEDVPFVTDKPMIYVANVGETAADACVRSVREHAEERGFSALSVEAKIEEELIGMDPEERREFLHIYGLEESALERLIRTGYETLGLISFFTIQSNQVQAWTVPEGCGAARAAGRIHTDFEEGFIRAQVMAYEDFIRLGGEHECRQAGLERTVGRDYEVRDGDIIRFLFSD